jgi:hypothetical protein
VATTSYGIYSSNRRQGGLNRIGATHRQPGGAKSVQKLAQRSPKVRTGKRKST